MGLLNLWGLEGLKWGFSWVKGNAWLGLLGGKGMYSVVPKGSLGGYTGGGLLWGLAFLGSRKIELEKSLKKKLSKLGRLKNEKAGPEI